MKLLALLVAVNVLIEVRPVPVHRSEENDTNEKHVGPSDHINGAPLERDGDLNEEADSEMFLGDRKGDFVTDDASEQLEEIFKLADHNDDGLLSLEEMKNWIHDNAMNHRSEAKQYNSDQFEDIDQNGDGFLDWNEYLTQIKNHITQAIREEREMGLNPYLQRGENIPIEDEIAMVYNSTIERDSHLWKLADADSDNRIVEKEFLAFQHPEHSREAMRSVVADLLQTLDYNRDGKIDEQEFLGYYQHRSLDFDTTNEDALYKRRNEFSQHVDRNHDGFVDQDELEEYMDPRNIQHAYNEAMFLIEQADSNKDEMLSLQEITDHSELFVGTRIANMLSLSMGHVIHWEL